MVGILDYNATFGSWVKYGLPYVPVMAFVIGLYFFLVLRPKIRSTSTYRSSSSRPRRRSGRWTARSTSPRSCSAAEYLWVTASDTLGMGGPVLIALVVLNVFRILR